VTAARSWRDVCRKVPYCCERERTLTEQTTGIQKLKGGAQRIFLFRSNPIIECRGTICIPPAGM
jgi:hypothetical protein